MTMLLHVCVLLGRERNARVKHTSDEVALYALVYDDHASVLCPLLRWFIAYTRTLARACMLYHSFAACACPPVERMCARVCVCVCVSGSHGI